MNTPFEVTDRNAAITDIEFLSHSVHRIDALCALAECPRSRTELRVMTGASASTVYRLLREFEDRTWVIRDVLDADRASVFVYEDEIPQIFAITDETVVSWAEETFEPYRRKAQTLSTDAIEA